MGEFHLENLIFGIQAAKAFSEKGQIDRVPHFSRPSAFALHELTRMTSVYVISDHLSIVTGY